MTTTKPDTRTRRPSLGRAIVVIALAAAGRGLQAQDLTGLDCMIEPHSVVNVSTREEGVLEEIAVRRGDAVSKGQVIARLESRLEKTAFELASARAEMTGEIKARRANLEYVQRQQDRITELYDDSLVPYSEQDKADTDVRLAEIELQLAEDNHRLMQLERERAAQQLALRTIKSPVDGVVVEILLVPGESVEDRAREIMTIAEVDPLNVEVILPAELFGELQVGTPAEITPLLAGSDIRFADVAVVDRTIDAASDTFGVQLQLENADHAIPGGIRCEISFMRGSAPQE